MKIKYYEHSLGRWWIPWEFMAWWRARRKLAYWRSRLEPDPRYEITKLEVNVQDVLGEARDDA